MQRRPLARYVPPLLLVASCAEGGPPPDEPRISGGLSDGDPNIVIYPELIDFGGVPEGEEAVEEVTVSNDGDDDLHIQNMELEQGEALAISGVQSVLVQPGGDTTFEVFFAPEWGDVVEDYVLVDSDDPDQPVTRVPVTGRGTRERFSPP
ncbi:MAG: hypothetical protein ABIO70_05900 [Pseudomonadota bacterium]